MVAEHITNMPCNKHSGKRAHTQMLVVHSIESPLTNGYAVSMAQNWLGRMYDGNGALIEASSNVIVSPDTLVRSVHTDYAAWHASWANSLSIGYEQAGYAAFTRAQWLTGLGKIQIDRLAREMALDAAAYGIPLVWLTQSQVNAIAAGNRTIKGLVTHAVIDPANRTDPGSNYPYDVLLDNIKRYSGINAQGTASTTIIQPAPEGPEMKYIRLYPTPVTRTLGKNAEWFLKERSPNFNHPTDENYACLGIGHYGIDLFINGTGLKPGETVTVQFWLVREGVRSGYFKQEIHGSADGEFSGVARFSASVEGALVQASVKASTDGVKLTSYGAEVTQATV